jgi:ribosome-associated protein
MGAKRSSKVTDLLNHTRPPEELSPDPLRQLVLTCLEDLKASDVQVIDVRGMSPLTDLLIIASGNSTRHVKGMADKLVQKAKQAGCPPLGVEGEREGEWVLVDLNDVIVHLMLPQTRAFYNLEKLWEASAGRRSGTRLPA